MSTTPTKVTRDLLRSMKPGEVITVDCLDGYDLESQKNTAYQFGKLVNSKYSCSVKGLTLTITRLNYDEHTTEC